MGRLKQDKNIYEFNGNDLDIVYENKKNEIIIYGDSYFNRFLLIKTKPIEGRENEKPKCTYADYKLLDLILKHDLAIGYDTTKDLGENELTKGYFKVTYKNKMCKLHRFVYKYFIEGMTIDEIFSNKSSIADGKEIHHLNGLSFDNKINNLILCDTVQEHEEYQGNLCRFVIFDRGINKFRFDNDFMSNIWMKKQLGKEIIGTTPEPNVDYQTFFNDVKNYLIDNEKVFFDDESPINQYLIYKE